MAADGAVLAGGAGRRFGRPKAGALLGGRTLVERAVDALTARCGEVVVVTRAEVPIPPVDARVLHDRPGPAAGLTALATALGVLTGDEVVVLACDLPFAAPLIAELLRPPPGLTVVATEGGRRQPLCARYPRIAALDACEELLASGALALNGLLAHLDVLELEARPPALLNMNTPAELARAQALVPHPGT